MRQLPDDFIAKNISYTRQPRAAVKFIGDVTFWVVSHDDISGIFDTVFPTMTAMSGSTQTIDPEKGYSSIGNMSISLADVGFTAFLRNLYDVNDTIINYKAEIYTGFAGQDISDFAFVFPYYVSSIANDDLSYTLQLKDTQRFAKQSIFDDRPKSEATTTIRTKDIGTTIDVEDTSDFNLVWQDAGSKQFPNSLRGFLSLKGVTDSGEDVVEYAAYSGKTATSFTGVQRGLFGTKAVDIIGGEESGNTEVEELVYLDYSIPKMILALLTGDLYGDVGQSLPEYWNASVTADKVSINSFANIGDDLWNIRFNFVGLTSESAKDFIAQELLRINNLMMIVNQQGELELKRFAETTSLKGGGQLITNDQIVSLSNLNKDGSKIRNRFAISSEYVAHDNRYSRVNNFKDQDSIDRNNIESDVYNIKTRGLKNTSRNQQSLLNQLANGIRARFSDPVIKPRVSTLLGQTIELELGDTATLDVEHIPDYSSADNLVKTFEVQGVTYDFLAGTADFSLFGSDGVPQPIEFSGGEVVENIDHTGWTDITTVLTGTDSSGTFTITASGNLPDGRYYYDGSIILSPSLTITISETVWIDCIDFTMVGAFINGAENANNIGAQGYFGGSDLGQPGLSVVENPNLVFNDVWTYKKRERRGTGGTVISGVPYSRREIPNLLLYVDESNVLQGLPSDLSGNGGGEGGSSVYKQKVAFPPPDSIVFGGAAVDGGAGLAIICENLFTDATSKINLSGQDANVGAQLISDTYGAYYSGSSGNGWPGAFLLVKKADTPNPVISDLLIANTGVWDEVVAATHRPAADGSERDFISPNSNFVLPLLPQVESQTSFDSYKVFPLYKEKEADKIIGVDPIAPPLPPTAINVVELADTPRTPLANLVTLELTATPPVDDSFSYARFSYRLKGKEQWTLIDYATTTEVNITLTADGEIYEIQAESVGINGLVSIPFVVDHTVKLVSKDPEVGNSTPEVPKVRGLELINRIDNDEGWNKFKSGNAEFKWRKLSTTNGGNIITPTGEEDLYLKGYKVIISDQQGNILRQEEVKDTYYVYTLENNIRDTNGVRLRDLAITVQALAISGFVSEPFGWPFSNPAPDAPQKIAVETGFTEATITFELPTDVDFVGVRFSGIGDDIVVSGNSHTFSGLAQNTVYNLDLISVDEFGDGASSSIQFTTKDLEAGDISGLSNWATEIDPVDLEFINANMAAGAVPSTRIESIVAGKIATGILTAQVDVNGGVLIDGANAIVQTTNASTYNTTMGAHQVGGTTYILSATDGTTVKFGIEPDGSATFAGDITGSNGTFSGSLSAVDGTLENITVTGNSTFGTGDQSISFSGGVIEFGSDVEFAQNTNIDVTVQPSGGDFATLNAALEYLTKTYLPSYKENGITATITLDGWLGGGGTFMTDQVSVVGLDLSWITITAATVQQVSKLSWDTTFGGKKPMFYAKNGSLPVIDALFRINNSNIPQTDDDLRYFISLDNARAEITPGNGVDDSPRGVYMINNSVLTANEGEFTDVWHGPIIDSTFSNVNISDAVMTNFTAAGIIASGGSVRAHRVELTTTNTPLIYSVSLTDGAFIDLLNADITGGIIVASELSKIAAQSLTFTTAENYNIWLTDSAATVTGAITNTALSGGPVVIRNIGGDFHGSGATITSNNDIILTADGGISRVPAVTLISETNIAAFNTIYSDGIIFKQ